nr:MAG TPA: hypothetical protein [Caudoviricetes sp.]
MNTTYYIVKYKYFFNAWGVKSIREDEIKFESLSEMYEYIAENFQEGQILGIQQVMVQEMDVNKNYTIAKQAASYKVEVYGSHMTTKYFDSYKDMLKFVEDIPIGFEVKKITDPYGNDLTCALIKKE